MITIINGSPNINENCGDIVKQAEQIITDLSEEVETINVMDVLRDLDFPFCTSCATPCPQLCEKGSEIMGAALGKLRGASGVIMISPVYFGTITGELKAFWDLCRHLRNEQALYNVIGAGVAVGAARFGGQETTIKAMHDMMLIQGMTIIGDGNPENLGHQGPCYQKPACDDGNGLSSLKRTCLRMKDLIDRLK